MLSSDDFIPLEFSISALRQKAPKVLSAITAALKACRPSDYISSDLICYRSYGKQNPRFALTYAQLSAYLDVAVAKHASVLIETDTGAVRSECVFINRGWLLAQNEHVALQTGVAEPVALRFSGTAKASVTPLYPQLDNQTPEAVRAELRRLKIRTERISVLPGIDSRDREIESLQARLASLEEDKSQADEMNTALARNLKMLTLENDQLRKSRAEVISVKQVPAPVQSPRHPSNVERRNTAKREARARVAKLASELWASPDLADCRTGKMAQLVRKSLDPQYSKLLPETDIALAKWLTEDVAPSSAKRGGRPSKSDPNK